MSVFNSNGATAKNCGNGLRCVVAYLYWFKKMPKAFKVASDNGVKDVEIFDGEKSGEVQVSINMGITDPIEELHIETAKNPILDKYLQKSSLFHSGMGNRHIIIFLDRSLF